MGHVAAVRCVQYDGRRVVSGAYDYMVKVWDPETETCLHTLQGHTNRVYSLQVKYTWELTRRLTFNQEIKHIFFKKVELTAFSSFSFVGSSRFKKMRP